MRKRYSNISWKKIFGSLIWSLLALITLYSTQASDENTTTGQLIVTWFLFAFFSLAAISMLGLALPKFNYLEIDNKGFKFRQCFFCINSTWAECEKISILEVKYTAKNISEYICVDFIEPIRCSTLFGAKDTYRQIFMFSSGLNTHQLLNILTEYHKKYSAI